MHDHEQLKKQHLQGPNTPGTRHVWGPSVALEENRSNLLVILLQEDSSIGLSQTDLPPYQLHQGWMLHLMEIPQMITHNKM